MDDKFDMENEIVEISNDEEVEEEKEETTEEKVKEMPSREQKNRKKSLKEKWNDLEKNKKITIIVVGVVILLIIVGLLLYFLVFKKDDKKPKEPVEQVVLENDNYRYENGYLVFLDKNNREIGKYECENKNSTDCMVAKRDLTEDEFERVLTVNENGQEIERNTPIFDDNYAFVQDGKNVYLYDIEKGEHSLELTKVKAYDTDDDLVVIVDVDGKYGLISMNANGFEYLIRPSYDYLGVINPTYGYLVAKDGSKSYVIDTNGKKLSDDINTDIKSISPDYIVGSKNGNYTLYNYEFEELLTDYDYIGLHDGAISLVKKNRLTFMDDELNMLTDTDGFRLTSSDYVKKYVYDSDNKLVETKIAYEVVVSNNTLKVTMDKDENTINMLEGKVNKNLDYVNYFDGKLYFYSDEEKNDLIGTYTCANKNEISKASDTLNNCHIYTKDDLYSGIYNNEYVFIYDNNANSTDKIYYVYDLKTKKTRGTYSYLEFMEGDLSDKVNHLYTSATNIIAQSATGQNKGYYGVLGITSNNIAVKVAFSYKTITKENKYYVMVNKSDSTSIYDETFNKISNEFSEVKLYDNYYVGINNDKLNIYAYNNTLGILKNDLALNGSKDYKVEFTTDGGFKITINGTTSEYDKNGESKEKEETPTKPEEQNPTNPTEGATGGAVDTPTTGE